MSSPVNAGDILAGKYQVERVLGMGGMGVVVAAKHLILGERVAIKFLLPQALAREDVVKRFIQEGTAANRLRGEHIGRVHDVGRLESGAPFLVMEYLDGKDLGAILRDGGPLGVEIAVDYLVQACEALAEAHSSGIIHRDLKPSNLFLIQRLDGSPSIKLIDFGISKLVSGGEGEGGGGEMTQTAVMMGSPLYMAPEQMASARDVDGRADIWSLGIILHTMLTGAPPFRAPSVMQVYELIVQGAPPIRKQRAGVPEGVEAAILRCLQKDRRQRFADVGELAEALAPFGPPEARFIAERIKRIVSARSTRDSLVVPASDPKLPVAVITPAAVANTEPAGPDAPASGPKPAGDGSPSGPGASSSIDSGSAYRSATLDAPVTGGPWDQNTGTPARRPRPALIAAGAAIVTGVVVGYLALRTGHGTAAQPPSKPAEEHAVSADPPPPTVVPGPSVAPSAATSVPSASTATTSSSADAKPPGTPPHHRIPPSTLTPHPPPPPPGNGRWRTQD
jgi:serine/threonine-protein kinase